MTLVLGAISVLIFSVKYQPAYAQGPETKQGFIPVGIIHRELQQDGTPGYLIHVIGYAAEGIGKDKIRVIAKEWVRR